MKKTKQFMLLLAMSAFMSSTVFAQLPDGSYGPDISMKKLSSDGTVITDTTCTIYQYTNAGTPVVMDVSAIWCGPCWSYHTSGALESLYNLYGPGATNEVMVYYVEGNSGTIPQLNGVTTDNTNNHTTQGNWVTGTPYPILPTIAPNNLNVDTYYNIGYFPTVYLICPDRVVTEIGQSTTAQLIAGARACPVLTTNTLDAKIFSLASPSAKIYCGTMVPKLKMQNYGTTALTSATIKLIVDGIEVSSYNWAGSLARLDVVDVTMPAYTDAAMTNGSHTVKFLIDAPNAGVDLNTADNEKTITVTNLSTFGSYPVTESFAATTFPPTNWTKDDGADGTGWARSTAHSGCAKMDFFNISSGVDYLMLPPVNMASATSMILTFKEAYAQYSSSYADKLEVQVSSDCGLTWASRYTKSGAGLATSANITTAFTPTLETQWRMETIDLSSLAGLSNVLIRFKATSAYGNNLYVDEINLDLSNGVKTNDLLSSVNLFPNPSNTNTSLEFYTQKSSLVNLVVTNTIGEVVFASEINAAQGFNSTIIPSDKFESGVYFVNIQSQNSNTTQKLVIQK
jgi:hypothetical protein